MADAIESEDEWTEQVTGEDWFVSAQAMADAERFFHWELEFPEVFMGEDSNGGESGFDAVIGNPPYVTFRDSKSEVRDYSRSEYDSFMMKGDMYVLFMELGGDLLKSGGETGFIVQNKFMRAGYGEDIRENIVNNYCIREVVDFHDSPVFDITAYPAIVLRQKSEPTSSAEVLWKDIKTDSKSEIQKLLKNPKTTKSIDQSELSDGFWHPFAGENPFNVNTVKLGSVCGQIGKGVVSGDTSIYLVSEEEIESNNLESEYLLKVLRGSDVNRYNINEKENLDNLIYPYDIVNGSPELVNESNIPNIVSYLEKTQKRVSYEGKTMVKGLSTKGTNGMS
jgi:hypothetical protein